MCTGVLSAHLSVCHLHVVPKGQTHWILELQVLVTHHVVVEDQIQAF